MRSKLSRALAALFLSFVAFTGVGCLGSFSLTSGIADWNRKASEEKWVNELIFLGLVIIPVYGFAIIVDALLLNSIEFWSGDNPVENSSKQVGAPEGPAAFPLPPQ
jgi:hypothetical protein